MTLNILLHYAQTMTPTVSLLYAHMMTLNTLLHDAQWHPKLHYPQMMTLSTSQIMTLNASLHHDQMMTLNILLQHAQMMLKTSFAILQW